MLTQMRSALQNRPQRKPFLLIIWTSNKLKTILSSHFKYHLFSLCLNYGGRFPCKSIQLFRSLSEGKRTFPYSVSYGVIIYLTGRLVWKVFHDFQRKKEGIKHFTDNLEFKEGWSTVKFPSLSYEAPAVLPHFSINGLERVDLMIIKGEQFFILSKRI